MQWTYYIRVVEVACGYTMKSHLSDTKNIKNWQWFPSFLPFLFFPSLPPSLFPLFLLFYISTLKYKLASLYTMICASCFWQAWINHQSNSNSLQWCFIKPGYPDTLQECVLMDQSLIKLWIEEVYTYAAHECSNEAMCSMLWNDKKGGNWLNMGEFGRLPLKGNVWSCK